MTLSNLANKKVALWGIGREIKATLEAIRKQLPEQDFCLLNDTPIDPQDEQELAKNPRNHIRIGTVTTEILTAFDIIIKTPGISRYKQAILEAKNKGVIFTTPTNLWFGEYPGTASICVTGTKGKSTTSSLVAHLLSAAGKKVVLAGNIGVPLFSMNAPQKDEIWVIEMSSYQAADFDGRPGMAVLVNLFPEHLDWHGNEKTYYQDKLNLLHRLGGNIAILNQTDKNTVRLLPYLPNTIYFNDPEGFNVRNHAVYEGGHRVIGADQIPLLGAHNLSNLAAALTVVSALGLDITKALSTIGSFQPLPHRLTRLGEKNGILYVDDSISTTPQSAIAAIEAFPDKSVTILLGGFNRGLQWEELAQYLVDHAIHAVVTMPDSGPKIAAAIRAELGRQKKTSPIVEESTDLTDAVKRAQRLTPKGGVILLSPAAPSYGRFKNFEERGEQFKQQTTSNKSPSVPL
ncbi:MAG: UDP-N-acetylmuramoylalanine--D-glutamate ligase [Parcubacteria group bacterium Gr01-1014_18]|nr:MAG: UDP-N-acetylmuramoylalanine--D-glutamate ligase [Parcubacteria group bacterium Greene0416_36]TSC81109.1 MAG: UDP-N-acetylmuramoylalanine--D-glutamate ligase [Parcubacteria group bacterium Gr01-1014_18]TSC98475.1 MAG: UDP-N-acetylmuramoylalanine--D-glutamate ligase [Parcubacteria group bacterium Greene1014_20]TSD07360.1 MAG: UDP-N-acetylmuramoylalanine--D-glutamate ligase [Parcubacteria group bacterium Greene0714_2]